MSNETKLIERINANLATGRVSQAVLATDDRVLARITDGIYRQPGCPARTNRQCLRCRRREGVYPDGRPAL